MQMPSNQILNDLQLSAPVPIAETPIATIWQVRMSDGQPGALKIYHKTDRGGEDTGISYLEARAAQGAVAIHHVSGRYVLMDWLDGPTLGDRARAGDPDGALALFASTAARLHHPPSAPIPGLRPLEAMLEIFLTSPPGASCPMPLKADLILAQKMAYALLENSPQPVPLHGDLHPDNVILTTAGPRVIDAKGLLGDPAFELANAMRHPRGMPQLVRSPAQIAACLKLYSQRMNICERRLARWAAVKCALSIHWRAKGPVSETDDEADLLSILLSVAGQ